MDLAQVIALFRSHQWIALGVIVSGYVVQLLTKDSKFWLTIPEGWDPNRWKPLVILGCGVTYSVLQHVLAGMSWKDAGYEAFTVAMTTLGLYAVVIKSVFKGNPPAWLNMLAFIFEKKTEAAAPPTEDKK